MICGRRSMKYHIKEISQKKTQPEKLLQSSSWEKDIISLAIATHTRKEARRKIVQEDNVCCEQQGNRQDNGIKERCWGQDPTQLTWNIQLSRLSCGQQSMALPRHDSSDLFWALTYLGWGKLPFILASFFLPILRGSSDSVAQIQTCILDTWREVRHIFLCTWSGTPGEGMTTWHPSNLGQRPATIRPCLQERHGTRKAEDGNQERKRGESGQGVSVQPCYVSALTKTCCKSYGRCKLRRKKRETRNAKMCFKSFTKNRASSWTTNIIIITS